MILSRCARLPGGLGRLRRPTQAINLWRSFSMFYPAPDQLTIAVPDAVHSFDEAVLAMLTMSGDPLVGAEASLALDESFVMGHVLAGMTKLLAGGAPCSVNLDACEALVRAGSVSASEGFHVAALRAFSEGRLRAAASLWECALCAFIVRPLPIARSRAARNNPV